MPYACVNEGGRGVRKSLAVTFRGYSGDLRGAQARSTFLLVHVPFLGTQHARLSHLMAMLLNASSQKLVATPCCLFLLCSRSARGRPCSLGSSVRGTRHDVGGTYRASASGVSVQ